MTRPGARQLERRERERGYSDGYLGRPAASSLAAYQTAWRRGREARELERAAVYCQCESPVMDAEHDAGCRRCGRPVDFSPVNAAGETAAQLARRVELESGRPS